MTVTEDAFHSAAHEPAILRGVAVVVFLVLRIGWLHVRFLRNCCVRLLHFSPLS